MFDFIEDEEQRAKAVEAHNNAITEINDSITVKIDEATTGLKTKNDELLGEKKDIQRKLKVWDGMDFTKVSEAVDFVTNNADVKLIKDGKVDEIIQRETSQLRSDHEAAVSELTTNLSEATTAGATYKGLYETKMIDDTLRDAALGAKVLPAALTDILLRGRNVFSLADDGSVEARDSEGKLAMTDDSKVLTTSNWIESLKKVSPHYWPASEGADAGGGGGGGGNDLSAQITAAADAGDMKLYRKLRDKQKSKKNV